MTTTLAKESEIENVLSILLSFAASNFSYQCQFQDFMLLKNINSSASAIIDKKDLFYKVLEWRKGKQTCKSENLRCTMRHPSNLG